MSTPTTSNEPENSDIENKYHNGANWFYAIALLSLMNTILLYLDYGYVLIFGFGLTQFTDNIAMAIAVREPENAVFVTLLSLALSILASVIFVLIGWMSHNRNPWAFQLGMTLYFFDSFFFLLVEDWLSIGFHALALFFIFQGFRDLKAKLEADARPGSHIVGGRSSMLWLTLLLIVVLGAGALFLTQKWVTPP